MARKKVQKTSKYGINQISIYLDEAVLEQSRMAAEEDDRTLSNFVNMVLKRHLAERAIAE